jgi:G:T-mismatch repair DNA endonuclease (very short patch repair protein)
MIHSLKKIVVAIALLMIVLSACAPHVTVGRADVVVIHQNLKVYAYPCFWANIGCVEEWEEINPPKIAPVFITDDI